MPQEISPETAQWQQETGAAIKNSLANKQALRICAGRSKIGSMGMEDEQLGELNLSECRGIVEYDPAELFVTARAGTTLDEILSLLAEQKQEFSFEPPAYEGATLGGAVATGITGSGMPYKASLRNCVMAAKMVNGLGDQLTFGAPVIKNVAGFDVARLMAGSYGTLGALIELTLRVTAIPEREVTLSFDYEIQAALDRMIVIDQKPWPVTAQCWYHNQHLVRLAGSSAAVEQAKKELGGNAVRNQRRFWKTLPMSCLPKTEKNNIILRCTCQRNMPANTIGQMEPFLIDWAGGLRWYSLNNTQYLQLFNAGLLRQIQQSNSHMWRIIYPSMLLNNLVPLQPNLKQLHDRIRTAFDPHKICNPDINWHSQDKR